VKCAFISRMKRRAAHISTGSYSFGTNPSAGYPSATASPYTTNASAYLDSSSSTSASRPYRPIGAPVPPVPHRSSEPAVCILFNDARMTISSSAIRFKPSPFHVVERALTDVVAPSEVRNNSERSTATMLFSITAEQRSALSANTHQVRFYCTSGQFYSPAFPATQTVVPIEFPPVVDIRVNGTAVQGANTRGLKKKPGTAPPVDLSKVCRAGPNRVDFTYMNNSSPFSPKV
jgi:E3 SUMO-protein ligase PIAS1